MNLPSSNLAVLAAILSFVIFSCEPAKQEGGDERAALVSACSFLDVSDTSRLICGQLQVPENHDKPEGRQISIAYVILKSENSSTKEFPMIHFTGGPGGQALRGVENMLLNPILKTRDIIRFDQRGIGKSSPLPDLTSKLYALLPLDLTSAQEEEQVGDILGELRAEVDEKDIEIEMYNTFQNARDVGMLMDHLGYEKYNLRGGSYGTRIARVVADFFPEKINAAIYDSPAPHKDNYLLTRLDDYSSALAKVIDYCENDSNCNTRYPNLKVAYLEMLEDLAESPLQAEYNGQAFYINPQDAIFHLRYELYRNDSRERAPKFIYAIKNNDLDWINQILSNRGTSSSNYAMFLACENYEEYNHNISAEDVANKYDDLELMPYRLPIFTSLYLNSAEFLRSHATAEMKQYETSDIPSLIFINQFDPVTPPENAAIFQSKMTNSQAFIINAGGHGGGDMVCKRSIMDDFMSSPTKPLDSSCLDLYVTP